MEFYKHSSNPEEHSKYEEKQRNENGQTILEKNMFLTYKKMLKIIIH